MTKAIQADSRQQEFSGVGDLSLPEATLIGSIVNYPESIDEAASVITHVDFESSVLGAIFRGVMDLNNDGKFVDFITVAERVCEPQGIGINILSYCCSGFYTSPRVLDHAKIIRSSSVRRATMMLANDVTQFAKEKPDLEADEYIAHAEQLFTSLSISRAHVSAVRMNELLPSVIDQIEARFHGKAKEHVVETPWQDVNAKLCGGLEPGDLVVVAGRPSMGKTAFAMGIADHLADSRETPAHIVSMEMPCGQLVERQLACKAKVSMGELRTGRLKQESWPKLTAASSKISQMPVFINDNQQRTAASIVSEARLMKRRHGIGVLVIDYLQLLDLPRDKNSTRADLISDVTRQFKVLAKELQIPVILLSQVNRECESRLDKRPLMSDLRGSGGIEQDADVVMLLYRHSVYDPDDKTKRGIAEVNIAKQRNGPIGDVYLKFSDAYTRFDNYDPATVNSLDDDLMEE